MNWKYKLKKLPSSDGKVIEFISAVFMELKTLWFYPLQAIVEGLDSLDVDVRQQISITLGTYASETM